MQQYHVVVVVVVVVAVVAVVAAVVVAVVLRDRYTSKMLFSIVTTQDSSL